jgi:NADPH:quinone reductase-like Zn-dependent oxidoreductase
MRALRIHAHGGPEVMQLEELPVPSAGTGEVLLQVAAASVNPIDWKMRQGLIKLPLPRVLGRDGAGLDTATGKRVLGIGSFGRDGTHAEYAVFAKELCVEIPSQLSFEQAAAVGIAGLSGWIPLVEDAGVSSGQRVLIHAGAGGVGGYAIQIARKRGAEVWTTCSAGNAEFCLALGANRVIDYTREDFTTAGPIFDVVFDIVGGSVHRRSAEVLKPGGILVFLQAAAPTERIERSDVRIKPAEIRATPERLKALMDFGLQVPIQARFSLERAAEAYELSRGGHARGKIILQIS